MVRSQQPLHSFQKTLLKSEQFSHYSLRATFFFRRLKELKFLRVANEVEKLNLLRSSFDWAARAEWGIADEAWRRASQCRLNPLKLFVHPRVIEEQPSLLLYYRCVAMISQKGLKALVGQDSARAETGRVACLPVEQATKFATAVNSVMSVLLSAPTPIRSRYLPIFLYATAGAQIDGSWRNAVGRQGETIVKEIIIRNAYKEIVQVVWKDDTTTSPSETSMEVLADEAPHVKILRLTGGFHLAFASEPDICLSDAQGKPLISAEVKAGVDPAGALERLGASMKSFEHGKGLNPRMKTIYVASCITEQVRLRIEQQNPFDYTFSMSGLLGDKATQKRFVNLFISEIVKP